MEKLSKKSMITIIVRKLHMGRNESIEAIKLCDKTNSYDDVCFMYKYCKNNNMSYESCAYALCIMGY